MKLLVINNMASGYGEGAIYDFMRSCARDGDEIVLRSTDGTTDMRTFLFDAEEFDLVVASGGDGTFATITYLLANTGIPVLPFPAGTANLLTMNLLSPTETHALATLTRQGNYLDFDIGEIELADGEKSGFSIMAGAGYDATIMKGANDGKKLLGSVAYFTSAFANATPQHAQFDISIDGETIKSEGVGVLIVNFSKIQFDLSVVHENQPRDGEFDVVVLSTKDAFGLIPAVIDSVRDRTGDFPDRSEALEIYKGSEVTVTADPPLPVQYDGEVTDSMTPFTVRVLPHAARFLVSDECLKEFAGDEEKETD